MPATPLAMPVILREPKNSSGEFSPFSTTTTPHRRSGMRTTFACESKPLPSWEIVGWPWAVATSQPIA
jgi:hypothetical protein